MDEFDKTNNMAKPSHESEPLAEGGPSKVPAGSGRPASPLVVMIVLFELKIVLRLLRYRILHCDGLKADESDSGDKGEPEIETDATAQKRRHILQRFIFWIALRAFELLFSLVHLFLPKYIRDARKSVSLQSHDGMKGISPSSYSSELLRQKDLTKSNGQEET
jgi:hypothetical protein